MPLFYYDEAYMNLLIPDPYTTSLAAAMYYYPPIRYDNRAVVIDLIAKEEKEKKSPQNRVQPSENIGRNIDTYA